jgi:hypothetical protein
VPAAELIDDDTEVTIEETLVDSDDMLSPNACPWDPWNQIGKSACPP